MGAIIEAFATTRPVVEVLGPNLILFLKNDEGNVRKLRKVWAKQIDESLGQAETSTLTLNLTLNLNLNRCTCPL